MSDGSAIATPAPTPEEKAKSLFGHPAMLSVAAAIAVARRDEMYAARLAEIGHVPRADVAGHQLEKLRKAGYLQRLEQPQHDRRVLYRKLRSPFWTLARHVYKDIYGADVG